MVFSLFVIASSAAIVPIETSRQLAELLPDAELLEFEGSGHVPTMTRPNDVVNATSTASTVASVSLYECGKRVAGPWRGRVGYRGLSAHHREGELAYGLARTA